MNRRTKSRGSRRTRRTRGTRARRGKMIRGGENYNPNFLCKKCAKRKVMMPGEKCGNCGPLKKDDIINLSNVKCKDGHSKYEVYVIGKTDADDIYYDVNCDNEKGPCGYVECKQCGNTILDRDLVDITIRTKKGFDLY